MAADAMVGHIGSLVVRRLPPLLLLVAIGLVWEAAKLGGLLPITVPAPGAVWTALIDHGGDLVYHSIATLGAALTGYVAAIAVAAALAGLAVTWPISERPVFTLAILIDSLPLIAVAPILMLWLGNGTTLHVIVAAGAALFPLLVGMIQGFKSTDSTTRELFHVLSASRWQTLTRLMLPNALPAIFSALKVAAPLALLGTLIAEWMGTDRGLGTLIIYALFSFNVPLVWLSILTVCALTAVSYALLAFAEHRLVDWAHPRGTTGGRST
ncbi:MAG: ABC transporter permease [Ancalomicrobiaceae bacterium]|nr:ABC transporter permease [Ancalomicrobiaceae bacterium]